MKSFPSESFNAAPEIVYATAIRCNESTLRQGSARRKWRLPFSVPARESLRYAPQSLQRYGFVENANHCMM
jgi:hypothetical protein